MEKLTLTLVGHKIEISSAKENLEECLGNTPYKFLRQEIEVEEANYQWIDKYVVHVNSLPLEPSDTLEGALALAIKQVSSGGVSPSKCKIILCVCTYVESIYQNINEVKNTVISMDKIMGV